MAPDDPMTSRAISLSLVAVLLFGLVSCGAPGAGSGSGDLEVDLSEALAPYQVLDLATGVMTSRLTVGDLAVNDDYRSSLMVFRLVPGGVVTVGAAADGFGRPVDPLASQTQLTPFYCGVFEITQGQWQLLSGGGTPWTSVVSVPAGEFGSTATSTKHPAFGLSKDLLASTLSAYNVGKPHTLMLPTNVQWERACRAGTTTVFSWGDDPDSRTQAAPYAVVRETTSGQLGPRQVGERQPNTFGLYDMHGNVWEIVHENSETVIRGGCWRDPVSLSRSAYRVTIDRGTPHGLVGARLVLIP
jgi:formylglycine-generating enzyme required for sulfatase activity